MLKCVSAAGLRQMESCHWHRICSTSWLY